MYKTRKSPIDYIGWQQRTQAGVAWYKSEFILQFRTNVDEKQTSVYNKIISQYSKTSTLLHTESSDDGKTVKISLDIQMKEDLKQTEFISKLTESGVSEVVLVASKSDVDY